MLEEVDGLRSWQADAVDRDDWLGGVEVAREGRVGHQQEQEDPEEGDEPSDDRGEGGRVFVGV